MADQRDPIPDERLDADIDELIVVEHQIVERAPIEPAETLPLAERASELMEDIEAQVAEDDQALRGDDGTPRR